LLIQALADLLTSRLAKPGDVLTSEAPKGVVC
jgi:hypothetical protein